tara:strand:+ start:74 stop:367 length:294 start_codon:yes stop_codon:yes gene_type:complete
MGEKASDEKFKEYLVFQLNRDIINLYKAHLNIVEDLARDHNQMLDSLEKELPKEKIRDINYFNQAKYTYIRKKILDLGNEAIRNFQSSLDKVDVELK